MSFYERGVKRRSKSFNWQTSIIEVHKKAKFLEDSVMVAKNKERLVYSGLTFHAEHISKIADASFTNAIMAYYEESAGLFSAVEALRVTLAKHQIPKSNDLVADAPGYARMNLFVGSLYWHFVNEEGALEKIDRRELGNAFLRIDEDIEMSDQE